MSANPHMIDFEELCRLSGKSKAAAVRRWAGSRGIRVLEGDDGPFTTIEAMNRALGVGSANDPAYSPEDI